MPTFQPKSEAEVSSINLLSNGIYDYEVSDANDVTAKTSGEPMIKLKLKVFDKDGSFRFVFDNLMFLESMAYKLRHACYASGIGAQYEKGEIAALDFNGTSGKVKIKQTPAKDGYAAKNEVVDYIVGDKTTAPVKSKDIDDSIPF